MVFHIFLVISFLTTTGNLEQNFFPGVRLNTFNYDSNNQLLLISSQKLLLKLENESGNDTKFDIVEIAKIFFLTLKRRKKILRQKFKNLLQIFVDNLTVSRMLQTACRYLENCRMTQFFHETGTAKTETMISTVELFSKKNIKWL